MNNKSQFAVFIIAISVIAIFIMYIFTVEPWTRYDILYGPSGLDNETNGETPPPSGEFYTAAINKYIGGTSGEQIGTTHVLQNIYVEHPLILSTIETASSAELVANWLITRPPQKITIPDFINVNNTEYLELNFTLASKEGNPKIQVVFNDQIISERNMEASESSYISIPASQFEDTNEIQIVCLFTGFFIWPLSQSCSLSDISVQRARYLDSNAENTEAVNVDSDEQSAGVMFVTFWVEQSEPGGLLEIDMNGEEIYEGYPSVGNESFEIESPSLGSTNIFTFRANEGGKYRITKMEIRFRTIAEPRQFAVITLPDNVAQEIRSSGKDVRLVLTVTDVVVDGWVYFKVYPAHILHTEGVMEGSVFADVPNREIDQSANTIRIEGPNSKFYVSQFRIIEKV